jgi:hypothetical protein
VKVGLVDGERRVHHELLPQGIVAADINDVSVAVGGGDLVLEGE